MYDIVNWYALVRQRISYEMKDSWKKMKIFVIYNTLFLRHIEIYYKNILALTVF